MSHLMCCPQPGQANLNSLMTAEVLFGEAALHFHRWSAIGHLSETRPRALFDTASERGRSLARSAREWGKPSRISNTHLAFNALRPGTGRAPLAQCADVSPARERIRARMIQKCFESDFAPCS